MAQKALSTTLSPVLSPAEVAGLMRGRKDVRLLDVRTPGEFAAAHIAGAYNVPSTRSPSMRRRSGPP